MQHARNVLYKKESGYSIHMHAHMCGELFGSDCLLLMLLLLL